MKNLVMLITATLGAVGYAVACQLLDILRRQGLQEDQDFLQHWKGIAHWQKRSAAGVILGLVCTGLAIAGAKIWGWQ